MKGKLVLTLLLFLSFAVYYTQAQETKKVPKGWEHYKEQYEDDYTEPFEDVWNAVLVSLQDMGCQTQTKTTRVSDEGLFKGVVHSDMCIFTAGDSTFRVLNTYSLDMPFVRGGRWDNGRMQYKFVIQEKDEGHVHLIMKTEMSGVESGITEKVLFWRSNGLLEIEMLKRVRDNIGKKPIEE